ncbi:MAG: NUDIX domain-containing protein [Bacteroidales bacterium]|jgi:ADP-ribose pyrophosphatase YjhB (NUDIX family)|nr:NUDIX domain-containing protein [Bacteroidales bacterium]
MRRIHFEKRSITVCSPDKHSLDDPNILIISCNDPEVIKTLPDFFDKATTISKLYIPTSDEEGTFNTLCSTFTEIIAGGGLVRNRAGDYLLIYRNGIWDLPKGKLEDGEDIKTCSQREVEEETGISNLTLKNLICVTHHCYHMNGNFCLKHTYWYKMLYNAPSNLVPQTEEDIKKATWVAKSSLPKYLADTYPSIIEVFKSEKII